MAQVTNASPHQPKGTPRLGTVHSLRPRREALAVVRRVATESIGADGFIPVLERGTALRAWSDHLHLGERRGG